MTSTRAAFSAILGKDLRVEFRTMRSLPAMVLFAVTTFIIFRFGLDRTSLSGSLAGGVLWTTLLFAAVLGINRIFVSEREEGGFDAVRLAPVDRTALFTAKATALFIYLAVLADRGSDLRCLLPGRLVGPAAADPGAGRGQHRLCRAGHPDLVDGSQFQGP